MPLGSSSQPEPEVHWQATIDRHGAGSYSRMPVATGLVPVASRELERSVAPEAPAGRAHPARTFLGLFIHAISARVQVRAHPGCRRASFCSGECCAGIMLRSDASMTVPRAPCDSDHCLYSSNYLFAPRCPRSAHHSMWDATGLSGCAALRQHFKLSLLGHDNRQ